MKKILIGAILFSTSIFAYNLNIEVSKMKNYKGQILIALFDKSGSFPKPKVVLKKGTIAKIDNKKVFYTFKNVPKGVYAVSLVHDENSNEKMDTNFIGMPKEGYGASNNPKNRFSPPTFKQAKFNFTKTTDIKIFIDYL